LIDNVNGQTAVCRALACRHRLNLQAKVDVSSTLLPAGAWAVRFVNDLCAIHFTQTQRNPDYLGRCRLAA
jgi:hypothetical protein